MKIFEFFKRLIGERVFWMLVFIASLFLKSHVVIQVLLFLVMLLGLNQFQNILLYWFYRLSKISEIPLPGGLSIKIPEDAQVELPPSLGDDVNRLVSNDLYNKAIQALSSGSIQEAVTLAEAAVEKFSSNFAANLFLGFVYDITPINKPEKAVYYSRQALKLQPRSFIPQFNLAVATNHAEGYKKSMAEYEKAEEYAKEQSIDSGSEIIGKLHLFLAHDYRQSGKLKDAKVRYEKAKEILTNLVSKGDRTSQHWLDAAEKGLKEIEESEKKL